MFKQFSEINRLKKIAGNAYVSYMNLLDSVDCGSEMLETFKPEAYRLRITFNQTMDKLKVLDPDNCPERRL